MRFLFHTGLWCLLALPTGLADQPSTLTALSTIPAGYELQFFDDCGVIGRQPHLRTPDQQVHSFATFEVEADDKARTVAWDAREVTVVYEKLDPKLEYILAITYANETYNQRVQSLWAGQIQIHGPRPLPKGKAERLIFRLPAESHADGTLTLRFKMEAQVNAVVSAIELWAPQPSPKALYIDNVNGLLEDLQGRILNLAYDAVGDIPVTLHQVGRDSPLATVRSAADGGFSFKRALFEKMPPTEILKISAEHQGVTASRIVQVADLMFKPVRFRPVPEQVAGLSGHSVSLDGNWRLNPSATDRLRSDQLSTAGWSDFKVPGQWLQQGYDLPQSQEVAVAREFVIPQKWSGYRLFLRFEAVHGGTRYWLNGKPLGESENLFTPVEWDITDTARPGETNRLDLSMKVDTVSEQLSYSSGYAFHNLGGIDRSVQAFALPAIHIRSVRIQPELDDQYRDADLKLDLALDNASPETAQSIVVELHLRSANGKSIEHSVPRFTVDSLPPGEHAHKITSHIAAPALWSDEKPNLYTLAIEIKREGSLLERIERRIGFRKVEVRDRQLYVNGRRVKLAGACRHETDPLTGRADTARHGQEDARLIKEANLNYVRTSHYPPTHEFLDAADQLGLYLEVEAPFCWVRDSWDMTHVRKVLTPTSAMIDEVHGHPSVVLWSLANESAFCQFFEASNLLCKQLDPTRPTTFNFPDPKRVCDIANLHYPPMPYDESAKGDNRPVLLGEYLFPVCHEQTDVRINPGLRELWAAGHSEPDSAFGKLCATVFEKPAYLMPGAKPGAWTHIYRSEAVIGGAIWAAFDEPFYLPGGKKVGYAFVHGPWGLIDAWRRPKPEWWLAKLLFSPVWFPVRHVDFTEGQVSVRLPIENRFAFTDLSELTFTVEAQGRPTRLKAQLPPASTGEIEVPVPQGTKPGDQIELQITHPAGALINVVPITLGQSTLKPLPQPEAGVPEWHDDGKTIVIQGRNFSFAIDRATGKLVANHPKSKTALLNLPTLHITRFDFGDLLQAPPYAVLPNEKSRQVVDVAAAPQGKVLQIIIKDRYDNLAGSIVWNIDAAGVGKVRYDYIYSGDDMHTRESGVRFKLAADCDEIQWRRWSEWGRFPDDHISRTEGKAKARRDSKWPDVPEYVKPDWPWSLDQTEHGTADFRAGKFNIYEATLLSATGAGLRVHAQADVHVRPALTDGGVLLHILKECRLGPVTFRKGDRISGEFTVELVESDAGGNNR